MDQFKIKIAVCGCHGKTTTSSLLAYALKKLDQKPSYIVGVPFFTDYQGGNFEKNKYFVVEADEYGVNPPLDKTPKFLSLDPDYIIATNVDFDHPDVYADIEETKRAFVKFFGNKKIIANIDDANLAECLTKIPQKNITTFGFSKQADFQITDFSINEDFSTFEVSRIGQFRISLFGKMNIYNAVGAVVMLHLLGFKKEEIAKAIEHFNGSKRRFEKIYEENDIYLFDDYAHHPTEIASTIKAAHERFKDRRIIVLFQPHTFSRTLSLLFEFSNALSLADASFIAPIFASARENSSQFKVSSFDIAKKSKSNNLFAFKNLDDLLKGLKDFIRPGDVIFTMGAGDIYQIKDKIIDLIDHKIEKEKDIYSWLTIKTHVKAENFFEAKTAGDFVAIKKYSLKKRLPLFILGGGSNVAPLSKKIPGIVVKNSFIQKDMIEDTKDYIDIKLSSGYPVPLLVNFTVSAGFEGFEYHKGLPGTVGGALFGNSKWTKPPSFFSDKLLYAFLVDKTGAVKKVYKDYFHFSYDYSVLKDTHEILLEAVFRLPKTSPLILKKRAEEAFAYRQKTQPTGVKTCGCFFQNISQADKIKHNLPTTSAGYLIDQAGLKDYKVGGYYVSSVHANFIVNKGDGNAKDLIKLVRDVKKAVKKKFSIDLKSEVITI